MTNKKLVAYIFITLIVILTAVSYYRLTNKISAINQQVLQFSSQESQVVEFESNLKELLNFKDYISPELYLEKKTEIFNRVKNHESYNLGNDATLDELYTKTQQYKATIIGKKSSAIKSAGIYKITRDRHVTIVFIILFLIVIVETISYNLFSREISKYLSYLEVKNYDFKPRVLGLHYTKNIMSMLDNLRISLKTIDQAIQGTLSGYGIKETLEEIYNNESFKEYIYFDRIGFASIKNGRIVASYSFSDLVDSYFQRGFSIESKESSLTNLKGRSDVRVINNLDLYLSENPKSLSTKLLVDDGYKSNLTTPIHDSTNKVVGYLFFTSKSYNQYNDLDKFRVRSISDILGSVFSKNLLIDDLVTNSALSFVKLVEDKDPETGNHLERMQIYSRIIALGLFDENKYEDELDLHLIDDIYKYAPLHDIGKVGIPDKILLKPGRLTEEEMEVMKNHSAIGARVMIMFDENLREYGREFFAPAINIAMCHHEKWDGTGYPNKLKGRDIPIEARIVTVADVFDALTSKRVYKEAFSIEKSLDIIKSDIGKAFDPVIVQCFLDNFDKIEAVYNKLKEV